MPVELEINIDDHQLKAWSKNTARNIPVFTLRGVKKSMALVWSSVGRHLVGGNPLNVRSNRLRSSITAKIYKAGKKEVVGVIGTNIEYAAIHEFGGTIRPKKGKYLRFQTRDKSWHTVTEVKMPKRPFMEPSLRENLKKITKILKEEMQKAIGKH